MQKCREFNVYEFREEIKNDNEKLDQLLDTIIIPKDFNKL
jgi:hypothetical protein